MSITKFKFVSPGLYINEIDNSQLPRLSDPIGPVIIGRAERGPSMRPTQINSFSDFIKVNLILLAENMVSLFSFNNPVSINLL